MRGRPGSEEVHRFRMEAELFRDSLLLVSHPEEAEKFRTAFISFSRGITKTSLEGVCLLGFIHFDHRADPSAAGAPPPAVDWQRPTSSPFLLCSEGIRLEPEDYREIGDLLTFFAETDGIIPPQAEVE